MSNSSTGLDDIGLAFADALKDEFEAPQANPVDETTGGELGTRFAASFKMGDAGKMRFLESRYGKGNVVPKTKKSGEIENFLVRKSPKETWRLFDPQTGPTGDILGDIADVGGDIVEAVPGVIGGAIGGAGGFLGLGAGSVPGAMVGGAVGDAVGSAVRQGIGAAMPGDEDLSVSDRLEAGAVNVGAGAVGGAIGAGLAKVGKTAMKAMPKHRLATAAASEMGEESVQSLAGKSVGGFYDDSLRLEEQVSKAIGEPFRLSGGQRSGGNVLLTAERAMASKPEFGELVAKDQQKRLLGYSKYLDAITSHVAADPSKLGSLDTGKQVAGAVDRYMRGLVEKRTAAAKPLFDAAIEASRGASIVPTTNTQKALAALLHEHRFDDDAKTAGLRAVASKLEELGSKTGRIGIQDVQTLLSKFGKIASGDDTIVEGLSKRAQKAQAKSVLKALEADLDLASRSPVNAQAADALVAARQVWRSHSEAIDNAATDAVARILKLDAKGNSSKVVDALMRSTSTEQLGGVMKLLGETSPDTARQLRGHVLQRLFRTAGKAPAESPFGAELSSAGVSPAKLLATVRANYDQLKVIFADAPEAASQMRTALEVADRLVKGPNIRGSDTFDKFVMSNIIDQARRGGLGSMASEAVREAVEKRVLSPETTYRMLSTPDGVDAFYRLVMAQVKPSAGKKAAALSARASLGALSRMLALLERGDDAATGVAGNTPAGSVAEADPRTNPEAFTIDPTNLQGR